MLNIFLKEILKNAPKDIANLLNDEKFKDVEKIFNIDPNDIKKMFNETKSSTFGEDVLSEIFAHLYDAFDTNNKVQKEESTNESDNSANNSTWYGEGRSESTSNAEGWGPYDSSYYNTYVSESYSEGKSSSESDNSVNNSTWYGEGRSESTCSSVGTGGANDGTGQSTSSGIYGNSTSSSKSYSAGKSSSLQHLNIDEIDKQIKALEVLKANKLKEAELERQHKIQVLADRIVILKSHMKSLHEDLIVDLENGNQEDFQHKTNEMVQVREEIYKLDKEITQIMLSK